MLTQVSARLERNLCGRLCVCVLYRLELLRENRRVLGDGVGLGAALPHRRQRRRCIANLWPIFRAGRLPAAVRRPKRKESDVNDCMTEWSGIVEGWGRRCDLSSRVVVVYFGRRTVPFSTTVCSKVQLGAISYRRIRSTYRALVGLAKLAS